jgi:tellurite resistance protein TerC
MNLFPYADYWWFYASFLVFVLVLLLLDLGVFHRKIHAVSFKEASVWTAIWMLLAALFNLFFYYYALWKFPQDDRLMAIPGFDPQMAAQQVGLEFLTGYIIEKSLAIDNIFVFVVVFSYFAIPAAYQHRILFYGILGALFFRALFIAMGSVLMAYQAAVVFFGVFLILTGIKMYFSPSKPVDPEKNLVIRFLKKFLPISPRLEGSRFLLKKNGVWHATPLFVALVLIEFTDIVFAVDSVPAIFAITDEPLIVFTSNIFAILGMRSMYFMLSGVIEKFVYLKYGLATILIFVGLKMTWLNKAFGGHFPISWSLVIIFAILTISVLASLLFVKKKSNS